ncbi:glutamate receptor 1-like [Coccinella septempunctata]|uniref:glutamate receptor 1-like n=1 Tax=Coccinella septempunctata TaxID=41139 RepID=UPI001D08C9BC|nr:glutamate receptor 1-like [Coccinella septempunctata]
MTGQAFKLVVLWMLVVVVESKKNYFIDFVTDFLDRQHTPTNVNSYLCWDKNEVLLFYTKLWNSNYRVRFFTPNGSLIDASPFKEHQLILIDLSCDGIENILQKADDEFLFKQPYRWIVFGNASTVVQKNLNIGVDSQFFVIEETAGIFKVTAHYKYSRESKQFNSEPIALWEKDNGYLFYNNLVVGRNRTNLNGLTLKISYVLTNKKSEKHLWDYRERHVDTISKLNYLLIHHLTDFTNATRQFIVQPSWGYKQKNSSFYDGMVGDLQKGIADLGGTASFFTYDRVAVVDYIAATYKTYMKFIFRSPPLSYVSNLFALPFNIYVWYSCVGILILTCIAIYLVLLWEWKDPSFRKNFIDVGNDSMRPSVAEVVLLEISAITQQGSPVEPKSLSGRIATIIIFIAVIFLYTSYSASIVVLLQSTTDSIRTLEDLLNFRIKLGVEDIVYAHYYFKTAKEPTRRAIYEQKIAPKDQKPNFMSVQEGIKRVQNEFFAFHVELSTGYKVISDLFRENEKCGLQEITFVNLIEPWLPIQKNSNYKEIMKVGMRRIHEHGLQHREATRIYTRKPPCRVSHGNFGSVGLIDCYFAFIIFGVGSIFTLVVLGTEVLLLKYIDRKKRSSPFEVGNGR